MSYNNDENPDLLQKVEKDTELKKWLVNYVGEKHQPEDDEVNVEMIIKVLAEEFPEFLLVVAEENFIRGYQQGLTDVEEGEKLFREYNEEIHSGK
tara:strand:- start:23367 stop:23651 length:285 start_codon:yes stop_codon:yes gene_type:complete